MVCSSRGEHWCWRFLRDDVRSEPLIHSIVTASKKKSTHIQMMKKINNKTLKNRQNISRSLIIKSIKRPRPLRTLREWMLFTLCRTFAETKWIKCACCWARALQNSSCYRIFFRTSILHVKNVEIEMWAAHVVNHSKCLTHIKFSSFTIARIDRRNYQKLYRFFHY